jgi:hypothetical protein
MGDNQGTNILVLHCPLVFLVSASCVSIEVGVVLQIALSTLIADRTIQGMVSKQKFHHCTSSKAGNL